MRSSITLYEDQYNFVKELKSEKLLLAFVEYMFEDIEPVGLNSMETVVFNSLKMRMDNLKKKQDAGKKWWKNSRWWWAPNGNKNACKNWENISKQQANNKQNNNQTTSKTKASISISKSNSIINNNLSISNDIDNSKAVSYWNEEINNLLSLIKVYNNWIVDWTIKEQRQYWNLLLWKLKKIDSVEKWKYTWNEVLEMILAIVSKNNYYSQKISGPKKIFYELWSLMQVCRQDFEKQKQTEIPFIPWIW